MVSFEPRPLVGGAPEAPESALATPSLDGKKKEVNNETEFPMNATKISLVTAVRNFKHRCFLAQVGYCDTRAMNTMQLARLGKRLALKHGGKRLSVVYTYSRASGLWPLIFFPVCFVSVFDP